MGDLLDVFLEECCDVVKCSREVEFADMTTNQLAEVKLIAVSTGSRVLGGATIESDYDYVITNDEYDLLVTNHALPKADPIAHTNYPSRSIKYNCEGEIINLIVADNDRIKQAWNNTTQNYLGLVNTNVIIPKDLRIMIFSYFRVLNGI